MLDSACSSQLQEVYSTPHTNTHRSTILTEAGATNYTCRSPIGVAGLISPWNLPIYLLSFKIAPAIGAGCTVVCKPSEMTSLTAHMLAKVMVEAGMLYFHCAIVLLLYRRQIILCKITVEACFL